MRRLHPVPRAGDADRPEQETCVICNQQIEAGDSVVFTDEGVAHAECFLDGRRPGRKDRGSTATG